MRCKRCGGLVILEGFSDPRVAASSMWSATRCINCGCIEDAVVRLNRRHAPMEKQLEKQQAARGAARK